MADHQTNRPEAPGLQGYIEHAAYRAEGGPGGIGAAVWRSSFERGLHRWDCIVSDGRAHHYLYVEGELGPRPNLSPIDIEAGIEAFATSLPERGRLRQLAGVSPLRIDLRGTISR